MGPFARLSLTALLLGSLLVSGGCGFCLSCGPEARIRPVRDVELDKIAAFMVGSHDNAEQVAEGSSRRAIDLEIARIWRMATDGVWLYVEQAVPSGRDRPFLQRVQHLTRLDDDSFAFEIFVLPGESRFIGAHADVGRFEALTPDSLSLKAGCEIRLTRVNSYTYVGATDETTCPSELRGAHHTTNEVEIRPGRLETWERGWAEDGRQIWGPKAGPVLFRRLVD